MPISKISTTRWFEDLRMKTAGPATPSPMEEREVASGVRTRIFIRQRIFSCVSCHPSDQEHNFAKGNTIQETVRDDLDNTMHSCEDCHYKGKDKKAPRYRHPFSPRHMKRIACQTCHIPYQAASADLIYDHASTGKTVCL